MVSFLRAGLHLKISEMLRVDDGGPKIEMVAHVLLDKAPFLSHLLRTL